MDNYSTLSLGEKIHEIRKAKGLSQENMAQALNANRMTVSRLERGEVECSAQNLAIIRKFLDIEKAPLLEHELALYRDRMQVWIELLRTARVAEARAMQEEMSVILDIPFEGGLYLLYLVTEALLLSMEYNVPATEEKLNVLEGLLDNASDEILNLYHLNKGFHNAVAGDYKNALKHSFKAVEYAEACNRSDDIALYNIGQFYIALGKPYSAIIYFERAKAAFKGDLTNQRMSRLVQALAMCYLLIGETQKANKLADLSLAQARSLNAKTRIAHALGIKGSVKYKMKMYEECIAIYDQALEYYKPLREAYVSVLVGKAKCLFMMKNYSEFKNVLRHGESVLYGGNPDAVTTVLDNDIAVLLNATSHLMTLDNVDSINYIQDVAIPHLRAGGLSKFEALFYCNHLETHYTKKRAKTKANAIAAISRDIYREIYEGEIEFD
ncbi:MAG: helix-turn-helix transcriptional regulator [Defluviitaleaceae bacterium]|nr:helix-turn-helix transcriptional regulator [Defluviitaleaceae bacterium]